MDSKNKKLVELLYAVTFIISSVPALGYGAFVTWTSPALPYLTSNKVKFPLLKGQFDTISSLSSVGFLFGYILNPFASNLLGTKYTLLLFALPQISSWAIIVKYEKFIFICLSKILGGVGYGAGTCTMVEYITEVSHIGNRGLLFALNNFFVLTGHLLPILYGSYLTYYQMNIALLIMPIVFFITFLFLPDSSFFLKMNEERDEKSKNQMNYLQRFSEFHTNEVDTVTVSKFDTEIQRNQGIKTVIKYDNETYTGTNDKEFGFDDCDNSKFGTNKKTNQLTIKDSNVKGFETTNSISNVLKSDEIKVKKYNFKKSKMWKLFTLPNNRRALTIMMFLSVADIFGGHLAIVTYTEQLLTHRGSILSPEKAALVLSITRLLACCLSTQIIERIGKKIILLVCGIIGSMSMALLGFFFYLDSKKYDISEIGWFPLVWTTVSEVANVIGVGNIFSTFQGELFVKEEQSIAISITNIMYLIIQFFALIKFQELMHFLGMFVIFWFFSVCCFLFPFITFFIVPETKGKSLDEIQENLKQRT